MAGAEPFWPKGCLPGCIGIVLLIPALQFFDWHTVGSACLLFAIASIFVETVQRGRFALRRDRFIGRTERPWLYWSICLVLAAFAMLALARLLSEIAGRGFNH